MSTSYDWDLIERLLHEVQNGANHVHSVWRDPLGDFGQSTAGE